MSVLTKEPVLTQAVDLARAAAEEVAPGVVGEYLGAVIEDERLVSHRFVTTSPGYRGWHWTVTLSRVPRGRTATVCEVELLPGEDAVLAPEWVPWAERLLPGDVRPGDVLPFQDDDDRLEPGYQATGEDADELAIFELGLGRERVLSPQGRADAVRRWYLGAHGPNAPSAVAAAAPCSTCGFLLKLGGSLRTSFGVCANEWSPSDGQVVAMNHGCGAHSQTDVAAARSDWPEAAPVLDDLDVELVQTMTPEVADDVVPTEDAEAEQAAPAEDDDVVPAEGESTDAG